MLHGQWNNKGEKMIKEFSVENWIIGGTCFLIIFTLGCYLWFHNVMASIENQYTETNTEVKPLDKTSEMPQIEKENTYEQESLEKNRAESKDAVDGISDITDPRQFEQKKDNSIVSKKLYTPIFSRVI